MKIGAVIVTYNSASTIKRCLQSLHPIAEISEILMIDNASRDSTLTIINEKFPHVGYIANKINSGFAVANNQGIEILLKKNCEYILLLNPDTEVKSSLIKELLKSFGSDHNVGISGCAITYKNSQTI